MKLQLQVLSQESAQLHENIQRDLVELYRLPGLAFPVVTGAFALAYDGKVITNQGLLYALFGILAAMILIGFNNVWMQLCTFTQYKYAQNLPRLYEITGVVGKNYGQYTTQGGILRAMAGVAVVQAILLPVALLAAVNSTGSFTVVAYAATALAGAVTVVSWIVAGSTVRAIKESWPAKS